jgi:hypothetical protein
LTEGEFKKRHIKNYDWLVRFIPIQYSEELLRAVTRTGRDFEEAKQEFPDLQNIKWHASNHPTSRYARWLRWFEKWFGLQEELDCGEKP